MEKPHALDHAWRDISSMTALPALLYLDPLRATDSGWMGCQLLRLFKECGLTSIVVTTGSFVLTDYTLADRPWCLERHAIGARDAGVISESQRTRSVEDLQQAAEREYFFGTARVFGVGGVK